MPRKTKQSVALKEFNVVFKALSDRSNAFFDNDQYESAVLFYSTLVHVLKEEGNRPFSTPDQLADVIWNQAMAQYNLAQQLLKDKLVFEAMNQIRGAIKLVEEAKNTYTNTQQNSEQCDKKIVELDAFLRINRPTSEKVEALEIEDQDQSVDVLEWRSSPVIFENKGKKSSDISCENLPPKKRYRYKK
jgi:hypothetical protein